jgi:hypothetical protein
MIDSVSHLIRTDQQVPFRGVFRMEAPKCTRFNLHFVDKSWAGGLNCTDPPSPTHRRRLLKVKGRDSVELLLQACCPHNKPCYTGGTDTTGADFLLGVRADGSLATTVEAFEKLCQHEKLEGAFNLPPELFAKDNYPGFERAPVRQSAPAPPITGVSDRPVSPQL